MAFGSEGGSKQRIMIPPDKCSLNIQTGEVGMKFREKNLTWACSLSI